MSDYAHEDSYNDDWYEYYCFTENYTSCLENDTQSDYSCYIDFYKECRVDYYHNDGYFITGIKIGRAMGFLSTIASAYIIQDIIRNARGGGRTSTNSRGGRGRRSSNNNKWKLSDKIILALNISDIFYSFFGPFLATWPAPEGQAFGSIGTILSCDIVGWFQNWGFVCSRYYNASLALCYLFMVRYNYNEDQLRKVQYWFLLVPIVLCLPFQTLSLAWQGGSFNGQYCTAMLEYPYGCETHDPDVKCERGSKVANFFTTGDTLVVFYVVTSIQSIISFPIIVVSMGLLYVTVLGIERRNDRYRFGGSSSGTVSHSAGTSGLSRQSDSSPPDRTQSKNVAWQGIWYIFAYLAVDIPYFGSTIIYAYGFLGWFSGVFLWFASVVMPLQGLFNALVYLRPKLLAYMRDRQDEQRGQEQAQTTAISRCYRSFLSSCTKSTNGDTDATEDKEILDPGHPKDVISERLTATARPSQDDREALQDEKQ